MDSITHWTTGSQSEAEVAYTYRILNLAAWAQRPEVQQAFPDIQATLRGASRTEQVVGLHLSDKDGKSDDRPSNSIELPLHAVTPFDRRLIWHERTQKDAGFAWLRAQICRLRQSERPAI